jgi:signal transduction histidine kinase
VQTVENRNFTTETLCNMNFTTFMLHKLHPNLLIMKAKLILLAAFCWPTLFFAQSSGRSVQLLNQGEQLLKKHADSAALVCAQNVIDIIPPNTNYALEGRAYLLAGRAQYELGYPEDAAPPLQKALRLFRQSRNDSLTLTTLMVLSVTMGDREYPRLDSSLFYLTAARDLALKRRDTLQVAIIYINIANVWDDWGEYDVALTYNDSCEILLINKSYAIESGHNYYNMGNTLLNLYIEKGEEQDLLKAKNYLKQAIDIFQKLGDPASEADARNASGSAALYLKEFPKAKNELKKSLELCEAEKDSAGLLNVYYNLALLAETEGKHSEAIYALKNLVELLKKVGDASNYKFVREQFSDSKGRLSITLIENKINNLLEKSKNERNGNLMLVGFSILGTLLVGSYFYYQQKMSAQRALVAEKEKLHQEKLNNLLKEQEIEFFRVRLEGEELGRQKLARKIHDGVGGLLVSAKWNLESALEELSKKENKVANRLHENIRLQDESYQELRRVVYQLEQERIPWWQDLQKVCERLAATRKTNIRFYTFNLDETVRGALGEEAGLIAQELITNALKHSKAQEITVQISRIDHILNIVVEDDGNGFDPNAVTPGMGLENVETRVAQLSGSIILDTNKGAGTTVFIDIPLRATNILENNPLLYASSN